MALTFASGATNSLNVTRYAAIEAAGPVTWCCWLRRSGNSDNAGRPFCKEYNNGQSPPYISWGLTMHSDLTSIRGFVGYTDLSFTQGATAALTNNTWMHVLCTFVKNSVLEIFIDGASGGTAATSNLDLVYTTDATGKVDIGGLGFDATHNFAGDVAECAMWDVLLTAGEIGALAKGASPLLVRPSSLRLYVPLVREKYEALTAAAINTQGSPAVASHPRVIYPRHQQAWSPAAAAAGFSTAMFRENAGLGAAGGGPFARANAGLGAIA